ncbi:unnamed protein product [Kluyveromyces dobzhanskii CBS 2104]|uniref:WGS project CCBQ000000000 data, contig 00106 n=1 Tax=Kluyveromyces dobzhanskii CBS 2104 TaxID=1427455 RepID=A0A0A8L869_9SACH|nr:unnamed protein product [Kluyveromyces dobzhanskii CBS 2104]
MLHPVSSEVYFTFNNGNKVPAFGLGTAAPHQKLAETKQAVKAAVKAGYRHIDTAWAYGVEEYVGEALQELFEEGVVKREDLHVTTKVWHTMWSDANKSLNESLHRLKLDYVDLLLQHWPLCTQKIPDPHGVDNIAKEPVDDQGKPLYDENGDWIETYKQIERIYLDPEDTRVRAIGVSNYPIEYLMRVLKECRTVPACNQVELHPRLPQRELREFCNEHKIIVTAYSPLGGNGAPLLDLPILKELSEKYDASPNDILTSFHIRQGTIVIPRSLNPTRIASNLEFVPLSAEDVRRLNEYGETNKKRFINGPVSSIIPGFREDFLMEQHS